LQVSSQDQIGSSGYNGRQYRDNARLSKQRSL
jgi:hypothetical protein